MIKHNDIFLKAFDTVDHKLLLKKVYAFGIRGLALESNHPGRFQNVVYDYQQSTTLSVVSLRVQY